MTGVQTCALPISGYEGPLERVSLGVRPEKIRLHERSETLPATLNRLEGTVLDAAYLGVSTQYVVELRDGRRLTVYEQNVERATRAELWEHGEEVALAWSPDHCFLVAEEAEAAVARADDPEAA